MSSKLITAQLYTLAEVVGGGTPSTKEVSYWNGDIPWITPRDLASHKYVLIGFGERNITHKAVELSNAKLLPKGTVIFSSRAPIGYVAIASNTLTTNQGCKGIICNEEKIHNHFLYYWLKNNVDQIESVASGSTFKEISTSGMRNLELKIPENISEQKEIAKILGDLDRKIELNRRMNETLEQIGQTLFKHYFVDSPESERWVKGTLGDIIQNFDSKRIPLSSRERELRKGLYRYFGATSVMDYVDEFIFDGRYLLLAEDGSVINSDGTPILQYVWGQFWVNNHAHVLQAKEPFTIEYLYLLLRKANVRSLVNGAVQLKINQGAMNSFPITIPPTELVSEFTKVIEPLFSLYRNNAEELLVLETLRDSLLPKLMSGQINV